MVPLSLEQVAEIISMRTSDAELDQSGIATDLLDLADSLGSLVTLYTLDTRGNIYEDLRGPQVTFLTLAHYSVEEYLQSGQMASDLLGLFDMDAQSVHGELANMCLQYVGLRDFMTPIEKPVRISY